MDLINNELRDVKKLCENTISGSKLISCVATMVRVEIRQTQFKRIIICIQFPMEYPTTPLLLELKSKTLSVILLNKLTEACEQEIKKSLGKPQVMKTLMFIKNFIVENPLCCCYGEIYNLRRLLTARGEELKIKQKTSSLNVKIVNNLYFLKTKLIIPDVYPDQPVEVEDLETNFPPLLSKYMIAQSKEIARQCVEPPLCKKKTKQIVFQPSPSLEKVVLFLTDCVKQLPNEECLSCKELCFPPDPKDVIRDEHADKHVERLYCGHLFHYSCLLSFMRAPPFGNKQCSKCKQKIYHDKWGVTDRLAEDRWAHEQARRRELAEVTDFFL